MKTLFMQPGYPWEHGYIESFNGKLRGELLNVELFDTPLESRVLTERWRRSLADLSIWYGLTRRLRIAPHGPRAVARNLSRQGPRPSSGDGFQRCGCRWNGWLGKYSVVVHLQHRRRAFWYGCMRALGPMSITGTRKATHRLTVSCVLKRDSCPSCAALVRSFRPPRNRFPIRHDCGGLASKPNIRSNSFDVGPRAWSGRRGWLPCSRWWL